MKKTHILMLATLLLIASSQLLAATVTFDTSTDHLDHGITLGGYSMLWNGTGGGHVYNEYYGSVASIYFASPVTLNSLDLNAMPWEGYLGGGSFDSNILSAYDASGNLLWQQNFDLTNYTSWDSWLTVAINVANVARLDSLAAYHWPSIDNLVYNASPVPIPAAVWLLGSGLLGLIGVSKRKQNLA